MPGVVEPGRLGLDGDHRDVVGHDVVQLAGDAGAFAAGGVLEQGAGDRLPGQAVLRGLLTSRARSADPAQAAAGPSAAARTA